MINYWGCELVSLTTAAQTCDCEKQTRDNSGDVQQPSAQKPAKDASSEFFATNDHAGPALQFSKKMSALSTYSALNLSSGINKQVFQPPRL